jgi:hypothetical protein
MALSAARSLSAAQIAITQGALAVAAGSDGNVIGNASASKSCSFNQALDEVLQSSCEMYVIMSTWCDLIAWPRSAAHSSFSQHMH